MQKVDIGGFSILVALLSVLSLAIAQNGILMAAGYAVLVIINCHYLEAAYAKCIYLHYGLSLGTGIYLHIVCQ